MKELDLQDKYLINFFCERPRGTAKVMLSTSSIPASIKYKGFIDKYFKELVKDKKYERFAEAPVYIVYSDSQEHKSCSSLNDSLN